MRNLVLQNLRIYRHKSETVEMSLGYQKAVKGIAMDEWERTGPFRVLYRDRQRVESVTRNGFSYGRREIQLAGGSFDRDFPDRHRTDKDHILSGLNFDSHRWWKLWVARVDPKKRMGIQK